MSTPIPTIQILMVEDNPLDLHLNQTYILDELKSRPHLMHPIFFVASSLQDCLDFLKIGQPQVILLDLTLPDSKGLSGFYEISKYVPQTPILIISGLRDEELSFKAVAEGAAQYLLKGEFEGKELVQGILDALELSQILNESEKITPKNFPHPSS